MYVCVCMYVCMYVWMDGCMYVQLAFPEIKYLLGASKISDFWTSPVSWILLIVNLAEGLETMLLWPWETSLPRQLIYFGETLVTASSNNINLFAIFNVFPAVSCWLKTLGICVEGLWVRPDFCNEVLISTSRNGDKKIMQSIRITSRAQE